MAARILPSHGATAMTDRRARAIKAAKQIKLERYSEAQTVFIAGSIIRGTDTKYSDIDLVVVFKEVTSAWRESFIYNDFPVEAFVHDPKTLRYFFEEVDARSGCPSLPHMVLEGIPYPDTSFSTELKEEAADLIKKGPPALSTEDLRNRRYFVTDLVDDLREPRNRLETTAAAVRLYEILADFYLRANRYWSAKGKSIPRTLQSHDPLIAKRFTSSFQVLFETGNTARVVELAADILAPHGGFLFNGHTLTAPETWKKP